MKERGEREREAGKVREEGPRLKERKRERENQGKLGRKDRGPSTVHSNRSITIHKALRLKERPVLLK